MFAEVLTTAASWNTEEPLLTYSVPPALEQELRAGQLVAIPYGDAWLRASYGKSAGMLTR